MQTFASSLGIGVSGQKCEQWQACVAKQWQAPNPSLPSSVNTQVSASHWDTVLREMCSRCNVLSSQVKCPLLPVSRVEFGQKCERWGTSNPSPLPTCVASQVHKCLSSVKCQSLNRPPDCSWFWKKVWSAMNPEKHDFHPYCASERPSFDVKYLFFLFLQSVR